MTPTAEWSADEAIVQLYSAHYRSLVRTASLLVRNSGEAEEIVQDAFVAVHGRWDRLRQPDKALAYLRRAVVNRARSSLRRHGVADRYQTTYVRAGDAIADDHAGGVADRDAVMAALEQLPQRQREVLVLRYYDDLSEVEIADALGVSRGAVKSHASRGMSALRASLEEQR